MKPAVIGRVVGPLLLWALAPWSGGCVGGWRREYPADWPERLAAEGRACPEVVGTWENVPEEDAFAHGPTLLEELIFDPRPPEPPALRLRVERDDAGDLRIQRIAAASAAPEVRVLRRGRHFDCDGGRLEVRFPAKVENANVCGAFTWIRATLSRDRTGALVVRRSERTLCVGVANAWTWSADWARYRPSVP